VVAVAPLQRGVGSGPAKPVPQRPLEDNKKPAEAGFLFPQGTATARRYLSLISLYNTCLRAFGSNFRNSSFSGVVFLFLSVV
jgi:hypothetical protein